MPKSGNESLFSPAAREQRKKQRKEWAAADPKRADAAKQHQEKRAAQLAARAKAQPAESTPLEPPATAGFADLASRVREQAEQQAAERLVATKIVPAIDKFVNGLVKSGQEVTNKQVKQLLGDVLSSLKDAGAITEQQYNEYRNPPVEPSQKESGGLRGAVVAGVKAVKKMVMGKSSPEAQPPVSFKDMVKQTTASINAVGLANPKISRHDMTMYRVGKFCQNLGLAKISQFCMARINPDNLKKINTLEDTVVQGVKKITEELGKIQGIDKDKVTAISEKVGTAITTKQQARKPQEGRGR